MWGKVIMSVILLIGSVRRGCGRQYHKIKRTFSTLKARDL